MHHTLPLALALLFAAPAFAADGKQQEKVYETEVKVKVKLKYLLALPEKYDVGDDKFPLILFLHGSGESGDNLAMVKKNGLPKQLEAGEKFPFIVVSPQSPGRGWNPETLNGLLDELNQKYRVDQDRVYLTGLSMGGYGTWALAAAHPERFAAIAPVCGGGNVKDAQKLKGLPTWVFHGAKDTTVPPVRSEEMVKAIKDAGGEPKLTIYPDAGHDSWTETYKNPELYTWFLAQKRKSK